MARYGEIKPPFKETDEPKPVDPYGIAKKAGEDVLKNLCDTHGMARPNDVSNLLDIIYKTFPEIKISMHLHNTNGLGLVNLNEALKFDINEIDTSMGGIGGSPFIEASSGNIATEDTIYMLENMGYDIGIDIKKISSLSRMLEKDIGESYFSGRVYKTI